MPRPVTPFVGCDVFVTNSRCEVLLIRRSDNGFWALPGGCQDLGETPRECAERECLEESGYRVTAVELLGVFSSRCYPYVHYPWKDNEFCHLLFRGELVGGEARTSSETSEVGWFPETGLPPLSDGHEARVKFGFRRAREPGLAPFFE